jgi:hypothetical protein
VHVTEWEELGGPPEREAGLVADRVISALRRRRQRRSAVLGAGLLIAAVAVAVPLLSGAGGGDGTAAADGTRGPSTSPGTSMVLASAERGAIYAAAIGGGRTPEAVRAQIFVRDHICGSVPLNPGVPCSDSPIPADVQRVVHNLLGNRVRFSAHPPNPSGSGGPTVIVFGDLHVTGNRATLGIELFCGPLCGSGRTLVLTQRAGQWQVTGSTGPEWIS